MTHESINLLPQVKEAKKAASNAFYVSLGSFLVVFFIAVILIMFSLYLRSRLSSFSNQEKSLRAQISEQSVRRDKLLVASERVTAIKRVLSQRKELSGLVSGILETIPTDFEIESINADSDTVAFTLVSSSLSDFDGLLSETIPQVGQDTSSITTIEISSFVQNGGSYSLGINFTVDPVKLIQ